MNQAYTRILTKNGLILSHTDPYVHDWHSIANCQNLNQALPEEQRNWTKFACFPTDGNFKTTPDQWKIETEPNFTPKWYEQNKSHFNELIQLAARNWWNKYVKNGHLQQNTRRNNDTLALTEYYHNTELHKEDGPALIEYNPQNHKIRELHFLHNQLSNFNGPAAKYFHPNGTIAKEIYMQRGEYHRQYGPAIICYDANGQRLGEQYYKHGKLIPS